jgi:hypothetical protein
MQRNSLFSGVGIGLLPPIIAHVLPMLIPGILSHGFKPLGLYVIAALINLFLVRYFYRRELEPTARGVLLITFALAMLLIFTKKLSLI